MRRSSRQFEGPAPGRRTRLAAVAGCLSAVALGASAAPAMAENPTVFTDNAGDGVTLREAINATPSGGTINLAPGTYDLTNGTAGEYEDANAAGDLDITKTLTIVGAGMDATVIRNNNSAAVDGVFHVIGSLTVSNLTVTGGIRPTSPPSNQQRGFGAGGAFRVGTTGSVAGSLTANRVKVVGNQAFQGAGAYVSGAPRSQATFNDSVITGNLATQNGGGISAEGQITLNRSAVVGNKANGGGGVMIWALQNPRGALNATNTTIGANQATVNGGGILTGGNVSLDFVTLAGNKAQNGRNVLFDGGNITIGNSLIAGSADNSCANNDVAGDITSTGFNIDQGQSCLLTVDTNGDTVPDAPAGDDRINVPDDALKLAAPDPSAGVFYFGLLPGSAALDTGTDFCFQPVDQRGVPRPQNGRCDVGAIEQDPPKVVDVGVESFVENPDPVTQGENLTYDTVVRNIGTDTAADVVLTTSVPTGTTFVSASNGCSRPRPDSLRCELGALAPNQAATVQLVVKTNLAGTITNRADVGVSATTPDVNAGNDRRTTQVTVNPAIEAEPRIDIVLAKAVKKTARKLAVRVGLNRANARATVSLFHRKLGTLVLKNVRFAEAGTKTVNFRFSRSVRKKVRKLKTNAKLTVRVAVTLSSGEDLRKTLRLKVNKKGRIVTA